MQMNRCVNCMEKTQGSHCPHCGFDASTQPQPEYALPWNTILHGKFLVGRMLGQGGFGITYVGWDLSLDVKVAIKEFYPSGQVSRQSTLSHRLVWNNTQQSSEAQTTGMESFLKEARKMARVDQVPQLVRVRETFHENGTAYIIMDFVEGETLKARLEREGPMPFGQAMGIFGPVLAVMEQVHKAGLIHRDLSPDNIMLEPGGGVRILDLGAAKDLAVNQGASSMLVAKRGFSPLEQYSQRGGSGPWSDVYSIAATMYFTLTGQVPPNAIDRLDDDELRWDLPALSSLPAPAREALQKALAVSAKNRTQSMAELLAGLERAVPRHKPESEPKSGPRQESELKSEPDPEAKPEPSPQSVSEQNTTIRKNISKKDFKLYVFVAAFLATVMVLIVITTWAKPKKAGPSVTWTLDNGVLTLSGSGEMDDYALIGKDPPWESRKDKIISVVVEPRVTKIGQYAFNECSHMTSITLPESVTLISRSAFVGCTSLTSITLPKGIILIDEYMFDGCSSLTSITIPENVAEIGSFAFFGCSSLTDITLPEGITLIDESTFTGCTSLASITIPKGVTEIGFRAFMECTSLTNITIPESVTEIGGGAFRGCTNLTDVYYGGTMAQWYSIWIDIYNEDLENATIHFTDADSEPEAGSTPEQAPSPEPVSETTPESTPTPEPVSTSAPEPVPTSVPASAPVPTSTPMPTSQPTPAPTPQPTPTPLPDDGTVSGTAGLSVTWTLDSAGVLTVSGRGGIDYSDSPWTDYKDKITTLVVESGITKIDSWAFSSCTSLTKVTLPNSVTQIGGFSFYKCTSLTSITLPEGITRIDTNAFAKCTSLTSVALPRSLTQIGAYTFDGCTSLTNITLPEGITKISGYAFKDCTSLTRINASASLQRIESSAFKGCVNLTDIYYSGTEEQWLDVNIGVLNDELRNAAIHCNS